MSKQKFIEVVESLFEIHPVDAEAMEYFNKTIKAKKVNKKEIEKATVVKDAIVKFLEANKGKFFDRTEIANALYNAGEFAEEYLVNDKGTVAYNSITALPYIGNLPKKERRGSPLQLGNIFHFLEFAFFNFLLLDFSFCY